MNFPKLPPIYKFWYPLQPALKHAGTEGIGKDIYIYKLASYLLYLRSNVCVKINIPLHQLS